MEYKGFFIVGVGDICYVLQDHRQSVEDALFSGGLMACMDWIAEFVELHSDE